MITQDDWNGSYAGGRRFSPLDETERALLAAHVPAPPGARALDVGCGAGELAAHLARTGYTVDAADWADHALADAAGHHGDVARWLHLDIEHHDWGPLHETGYDLITLRLVYAFFQDRARVMRELGRRLRPGGAVVVITPLAAGTPPERRAIALDEDEVRDLRAGWAGSERHDLDELAVIVLRHAPRSTSTPLPTERAAIPAPAAATARTRPREHRLGLDERHYGLVASGRKTVEVRVHDARMKTVAVDDTLVFHDRRSGHELDVRVQRITPYASFEELLDAEDLTRTGATATRDEQLADLRRIYPPEKEALGPLALAFDHRPARAGRSMPLSPVQYARTVPHHTVYAGLYVRDAHDRPLQLRSVYGSRVWQFPGGAGDADEDPLQTVRREAVEETGLELGQGEPRLLLTHYLHPGPQRPLGKVGFIFDGGRLTAGQLDRMRLDPAEHDMWAVHDLAEWRRLMDPEAVVRLDAVERARLGQGPHYLVSGP